MAVVAQALVSAQGKSCVAGAHGVASGMQFGAAARPARRDYASRAAGERLNGRWAQASAPPL